jgi:hypothetical protein
MKIQPKHFLAITIVSALAAGAFFLGKSLSFVWNKEHKLQTSSDVIGLQTAINNFYSEYGSLPKLGVASGTTDGAIGETLLIILFGKEASGPTMQNPKQITFLNAKVNKDRAKGGLVHKNGGSSPVPQGLYDAWGMPFHFVFDDDYNKQIPDPLVPGNVIRNKPVVIYSLGVDGRPGGGDDIKTW